MRWIYGVLLAVLVVSSVVCNYRAKGKFRTLPGKEHPLKVLYPLAEIIAAVLFKWQGRSGNDHIRDLLRSMYVKENIEKEQHLYQVRKIAAILGVAAGLLALGLTTSFGKGDSTVTTLEREPPGQGTILYDLEVDYRNREEELELAVGPQQYTESEILEQFETAYDEVRILLLAENASSEEVRYPLDLISEYAGISIYWEIDDPDTLSYNGEIRAELSQGEAKLVNLTATFSMEDVTARYTYPIRLIGADVSEREQLLSLIREAIARENDIHNREVDLPAEIDGYRVSFHKKQQEQGYLFLFLTMAAMIFLALFYDRNLENKVKKRQEQMLTDFPEIVSKLSLLYEAGLSIHGAFERICADQEKKKTGADPRYAYQEMRLALEKIRSGVSESQAYAQFGKRCALYPYIKLGNLLEQNLSKGTKGMKELLKKEVEDSFEERKRFARKKGEEAGTKMLAPMVLMLLVVIAIIALPALLSMNV